MSEAQYTVEQAHLHFAKRLNGRVWQLLEAEQRTAEEDALMVHAAHACPIPIIGRIPPAKRISAVTRRLRIQPETQNAPQCGAF